MPRLTKTTIVQALTAGGEVGYKAANKSLRLSLELPQTRRLFRFLLELRLREAKGLTEGLINALWEAYEGPAEGAAGVDEAPVAPAAPLEDGQARPIWRIARVTTKNFGGINLCDGDEFEWDLRSESWLLDGPNGSGKSSLLGAIVWAFSGKRPRDDGLTEVHHMADVLDDADKKIGSWPPLAAYPANAVDLMELSPYVLVTVHLVSDQGGHAHVRRSLEGGKVETSFEGDFDVDDVFVSTGITMPTVLPSLRFKDKSDSALTQAVAQLTGLDELQHVGELADGLSHATREYASYAKKNGLQAKLDDFKANLAKAKEELAHVGQELPTFETKDAVGADSPLIQLGKALSDESTAHTATLSSDISPDIDASKLDGQREIMIALAEAQRSLTAGLAGVGAWSALEASSGELTAEVEAQIVEALVAAERELQEALEAEKKQKADNRFRLKASAAAWHFRHGDVANDKPLQHCPLCEQALPVDSPLHKEFSDLREANESSQLSLSRSLPGILEKLKKSVPEVTLRLAHKPSVEPRQALIDAVRAHVGQNAVPLKSLITFRELVEHWLETAPEPELVATKMDKVAQSPEHLAVLGAIHGISRALTLAKWYREVKEDWQAWWNSLVSTEVEHGDDTQRKKESLKGHLERLGSAMDGAKPYSRAVSNLRAAILAGREYEDVYAEQQRREKVIAALAPLKQLPALAQSVAKEAIEGLSSRIKTILEGMHASERFQYKAATLQKRDGLVVRGSFEGDLRVDVSLIANTSWLRSTLWAFIFALRQEAIEQHGGDPFPVWLFDDPQLTFDLSHRVNWSSYVAGLKNGTNPSQVIIATHDEAFAAKLRHSDLGANEATLKPASVDSGQMLVLEGTRVNRYWESANTERSSTEKAALYISEARIYLEGMLKAMLAGQGADVKGEAPVALALRIERLHLARNAPWDKQCFADLVSSILAPAIKDNLNEAHHADRSQLTFGEASLVHAAWKGLSRLLTRCFKEVRDHRLLHGMPSAFQLTPSELDFPDGFAHLIEQQQFPVLGRASAFSGRISEGALNYEEFKTGSVRGVRLGQHGGYRLTARTLEPVARPGDILLVHQAAPTTSRSLVVAIAEEKLVARRFTVSEASSDVAVLTANALDPYEIAQPIVARKETLKLRRVVGVLFSRDSIGVPSSHEVQQCAAESELTSIISRSTGLVAVAGQSAQPLALDGQYLLVGAKVRDQRELARLNGLPVIASDSEQHRYFKRLRLMTDELVVLESLDGGGDYPPELLTLDGRGTGRRVLEECWEVLGVLFELPNA